MLIPFAAELWPKQKYFLQAGSNHQRAEERKGQVLPFASVND
jgi:hypothetical protein